MQSSTLHLTKVLLSVLLVTGMMSSAAQESSTIPKVGDSVTEYYKVPPRDGEFRRSSSQGMQGISCMMIAKAGTPSPTDLGYRHCLRMGPLNIGVQVYQLQNALLSLKTIPEQNITKPRIIEKSPNGAITAVFPIATAPSGDGFRVQSYLVAIVDSSGTVQTIQLTGKPSDTSATLPFSSITLGTTKEKVVDILGNPSSISDVPQVQGKLWSYAPFPFTIEIVNGSVYSVRIQAPNESDYSKVFIPLKALPE